MSPQIVASVAICALVGWAALLDLAARSIPNWVPFALLLVGLASRIHESQAAWGAVAFAAVFAASFLAWRRNWMGGGDVKLFAAGALAVPPRIVPGELLVISLAGGALALLYLGLRRVVPRPRAPRPAGRVARILRAEQWRISRGGPLPYACAISAGIAFTLLKG